MENVYFYIRDMFKGESEEEEVTTDNQHPHVEDPVVYEKLNEMMNNNEVEIVGL